MSESAEKPYDLELRTALFAKQVRDFTNKLPNNVQNAEYIPQLIKASSSPGANYIEANEKLGGKDFNMRIKMCLKEAKESGYWLRLVVLGNSKEAQEECTSLQTEAIELVRIFSTILKNRGGSP